MTQTNYIPGMCNINPAEIRRRRMSGHLGLVISLVLLVALLVLHARWYLRIALIIPLFIAAIGYLQARNKFCVGYAGAGQQHADNGEIEKIKDKKSLDLDSLKARTMNLQALIIAAVITAIITLIPIS
jgi:hypothetical protein